MTRKTMLLAGAAIAAVVVAGVVGQQVYRGQALRAVETGLSQLRAQGIAGNTVAWAGQERDGETVVLHDVTVTAPGGKVLAQAARGVVKPKVTGRVDVTAGDVLLTASNGTDQVRVAALAMDNLAAGSVPAAPPAAQQGTQPGAHAATAQAWLAALDGAALRATDLTALDGPLGPTRHTAGHLDSLDAAIAGGRLTRLVAERFTAAMPATGATPAQDAALDRLEVSGLDLGRILALQDAGPASNIGEVRAALRSGDVRLSLRGLRAGPVLLDNGELTLTPAGTDHFAVNGGRVAPQLPRPAALNGVELTSLTSDSRFGPEGWTGEANTDMQGLGRLRLMAKGQGQAQGDAPMTVQRLGVRLEDAGMVARIAMVSGVPEQGRAQWAQMTGNLAKSMLAGTGVVDTSGLDARLTAFLAKGTPLEFAVESTLPGGFVVPNARTDAAAAVPPPGSLRVVAP